MTTPMRVSICVPTRGRPHLFGRLLGSLGDALDECGEGVEVVVGSSDTYATTHKEYDWVTFVRTPPDASSARNGAASAARGDYLAFLDDDVTVPSSYVRMLGRSIEVLRRNPATPGMVGYTDRVRSGQAVDEAWLAAGFDRFFTLARYHDRLRWGCTSNLVVSREAFLQAGGFRRAGAHVGGEDIDLGLRLTSDRPLLGNPMLSVTHSAYSSSHLGPLLRKAMAYGASEQWLAENHPQYACLGPRQSNPAVPVLSPAVSRMVRSLRMAFRLGGTAHAIRRARMPRVFSPTLAAMDVAHRASDELCAAGGRVERLMVAFLPAQDLGPLRQAARQGELPGEVREVMDRPDANLLLQWAQSSGAVPPTVGRQAVVLLRHEHGGQRNGTIPGPDLPDGWSQRAWVVEALRPMEREVVGTIWTVAEALG